MTKWYEDLRHYQHTCGQPLLVGFTHSGYIEFPIFQTEPACAVRHCPRCGRRLNLNHCQHTPPPVALKS